MMDIRCIMAATGGSVGTNDNLTLKIVTNIEPSIWRSHLEEQVPSTVRYVVGITTPWSNSEQEQLIHQLVEMS
jgi:hypothetical protein